MVNVQVADIPAYIIGIKEPVKKIEYLKKFDINATWFEGITPRNENEEQIKEYISNIYGIYGSKSANRIGATHMLIWEEAIKKKNKYTMIFEDDVIFYSKFNKYINKCLQNVPDDFDILFIGAVGAYEISVVSFVHSILKGSFPKAYKDINRYIKYPSVPLATHAYIISKKGAKKLIKLLKGKIKWWIDSMILYLHIKKKIKCYTCFPELAYQTSTIDNNSTNSKCYFPFVLNELTNFLKIDRYVNLKYFLNSEISTKLYLNNMVILFLIVGILTAKINIKIKNIVFLILLSFDLLLRKLNKKYIIQIILCYIAFVLPNYIKFTLAH